MMLYSILFVCHGNICRSPMAEMILRKRVSDLGVADSFVIASAAVSREEIWNGVGNPVYPPARTELARHGIPCGDHRATLLQKSDYEKYDLLLGMDEANCRSMKQILGGDPDGKVRLLLSFTPRGGEVDDPWYSGDFSAAYRDISDGCDGLLAALLK